MTLDPKNMLFRSRSRSPKCRGTQNTVSQSGELINAHGCRLINASLCLRYTRRLNDSGGLPCEKVVDFPFFIMHNLTVNIIVDLSTEANGESLQIAFFSLVIQPHGSCSHR